MCKPKTLALILLFGISVISTSKAANVIYVDASGPNEPGTGTFNDPFRRIQDAIDDANESDTVEIRPGIYTTDPNNYNLDPKGKSITIRSIDPNDPDITANTIIDPNRAGRGFYFHSNEDANCIVAGLTIRNGRTGGKGGGVFCYYSSPTITNCIVSGNYAETHGGGFFCQNSNAKVTGCVIKDNESANDGGGIEYWRGKSVVTNCIISDNHANGVGGGVDYFDSNDVALTNCTFAKNSANSGGAVYCWGSNVAVKNTILWANEAGTGPQVALDTTSTSLINWCDVQGGEIAIYDPAGGLIWDGNTNIDTDPCFASFDPNSDPNTWDFHLKSAYGRWDPPVYYAVDITADGFVDLSDFAAFAGFWRQEGNDIPADFDDSGVVDFLDLKTFSDSYLTSCPPGVWVFDEVTSPCIDAGDPNSDWSDEPWPNGKRINMGAFGGTNQASMNGNSADFDVDGSVDFADFAQFANKWFAEQNCIEDLSGDGLVEFADLGLFSEDWLWHR